ncbi:type II toxin-antitoxin system VapB family antitoxin [Litoribacter ruber]|uniref:Type II toxin-antitoxin system VapB family antitoxin n=1 Tax=Litoribacter ruber TaxID=702568 RepID=A0AAP2CHK3_9BACT|nr:MULTISPECIES: type II toxin-antitoxin system VapB family antitoxin [Litoribacter]MBS9524848.1 type II toxin-antitoxin system VapB family antitoxin [Litoribacter alkaliphilus]MBT0812569.1 type II toxin-antitoxin system VapB family antitoxin [Litoribacter ruber]
MKVTAIIPDEMIEEAMRLSQAGTITEALKTALQEYISMQKLKELSSSVLNEPLEFNYSAKGLRKKNRE